MMSPTEQRPRDPGPAASSPKAVQGLSRLWRLPERPPDSLRGSRRPPPGPALVSAQPDPPRGAGKAHREHQGAFAPRLPGRQPLRGAPAPPRGGHAPILGHAPGAGGGATRWTDRALGTPGVSAALGDPGRHSRASRPYRKEPCTRPAHSGVRPAAPAAAWFSGREPGQQAPPRTLAEAGPLPPGTTGCSSCPHAAPPPAGQRRPCICPSASSI